ncbi:MAG TPA: ATP-binding protein [Flavobacteriales bacterium]|nr:ATP-binding protein [Flavobacteriales bacterium]
MQKTSFSEEISFRQLFESAPGLFLVLAPNPPEFTIVAVSNAYLEATMTKRNEIVGRGLFQVFPDNPDDKKADGTLNLRRSLMHVLDTKKAHTMDIQKYDIKRPISEGGEFEVRYWSPVNTPLFNGDEISCILHKAEDVTLMINEQEKKFREFNEVKSELEEKIHLVKNNERRINRILSVLLNYTTLDFSETLETSEQGDELDAIAVGLNTLSEELQSYIEQLNKNEASIKQTNEFLNTILENIPNMIFVKDAKELRFVRFNKAGEELLGFNRDMLLGKNDYDFFPKEQADFFISKDRETLKKRVMLDIPEEYIQTADGQKTLHTKKIPIYGPDDTPAFLLGISENITEQKLAEAELKKYHEQLETANKELESFSYSISHDLRAPLRAIHGYTKILEEDYFDKLDKEGKETIQAVLRNSKRMGELIDDLLAFSRLGKKELSTEVINMDMLVREVCDEVISPVMKHKVNLVINEIHPAQADYALIRQVLINLVSNAVKFSSGRSISQIAIGSTVKGNLIEYVVSDNGVGFDMRYYNKLFGVFQRLHSQEDFSGTGVGLAIVKRIVQKHHGQIWAESELNTGTRFYFTLPKIQ